MMMFRKKRRRSFRRRMRHWEELFVVSIFILVAGYLLNMGLHRNPGITLAIATVAIIFIFIMAPMRNL